MKQFLRNNSLSIVWLGGFLLIWGIGQTGTGFMEFNSDQEAHHRAQVTLGQYLVGPHFLEATMENWESEFLQMFLFIVTTAFLFQKGSAESKDPDGTEDADRDPRKSKNKKNAPWPVRRGGWVLKLYENSLSLAFLLCFLGAFYFHAVGGAGQYNIENSEHGISETVTAFGYMATSRFWFESLQNWQSEFLSVGMMVLLSVWLRQRYSAESKPVDAPHSETGK